VLYPEHQVVLKGDPIRIQCVSCESGFWSLKGRKIVQNGSELVISSAAFNHAGVYSFTGVLSVQIGKATVVVACE